MLIQEKIKIIADGVDRVHTIPTYSEDRVNRAIRQALRKIREEEDREKSVTRDELECPPEYKLVKAANIELALQFLKKIETDVNAPYVPEEMWMFRHALELSGLIEKESAGVAAPTDSDNKK